MSKAYYDKLSRENKITVVSRGCYGTPSLVEYSTLPKRYRDAWESQHGDPEKSASRYTLLGSTSLSVKAAEYYAGYTLSDGGNLDLEVQARYVNEAALLEAVHFLINDRIGVRRAAGTSGRMNRSEMWNNMALSIHEESIHKQYPHKLPKTGITLKRKHDRYMSNGYEALIHSGYCNDNSRKVTAMLERLILSLYTAPNKPFMATVYDMYRLFIDGKIEVFDKKSGELFERSTFMKNGQPIEISEATIWNIINRPDHRILVDEIRNDGGFNNRVHRPFHRRRSPVYSFSKITMDDRDLTRKMHNGKRVKAYYAYDVTSGCVIGYAHSKDKNRELFLDCLRNTFQTIERNGWGMPMEVEVEHHLVSEFFDDLAVMFPFLRICAAGNSREKRAEHKNREKKYGTEKLMGQPVGRWYARHEAYYQPIAKVADEYVVPTGDYERIVADDIAAIAEYNNSLHKKQKTYEGKTRWDVLRENISPDLLQLNKSMLYRYVGHCVETSIRASKEVTVQYTQYQLPAVEVMSRLRPNNLKVEAYYIPDADGVTREVHLYQGDTFIGTCKKINPYNEAQAERTAEDMASLGNQTAYDNSYRRMVRRGKDKLAKIGTMPAEELRSIATEAAPAPVKRSTAKEQNAADDLSMLLNNDMWSDPVKTAINNL